MRKLLLLGSLGILVVFMFLVSCAPREEAVAGEAVKSVAVCGDSLKHVREQCDDGNKVSGDGCSSVCKIESGWSCTAPTTKKVAGGQLAKVPSKCTKQDLGVQLQCVTPPSGLVGWWPGDGNANDLIGGKNGVLKGAAFSSGKVGQAFKFDGKSDIEVADDPSLNQSAFTVAAWIKLNTISGSSPIISKEDSWEFSVSQLPGNPKLGNMNLGTQKLGSSHQVLSEGVITTVDNWYHVVATYDTQALEAKMYLNGQEIQATFGGSFTLPADSDGPLHIGNVGFINLNGFLDEVAFWNRTLTATEIKSLFDADAAGMCK